jgi:hypothetical protein
MTTEPAAGGDALDRASAAFWRPVDIDAQVLGAEPLSADESFGITDLTYDEWAAFAYALHE